ncbi:hypothetical protein CQ010_04875 [Arthrobacter sp. MYb211]|nr:hypothetical protein CQ015_00870 [Arthrobacter sp. MYb221]PRC09251.1 hypothetical protein CQ010_04875 [Arthrobacter sp. MYb211]
MNEVFYDTLREQPRKHAEVAEKLFLQFVELDPARRTKQSFMKHKHALIRGIFGDKFDVLRHITQRHEVAAGEQHR